MNNIQTFAGEPSPLKGTGFSQELVLIALFIIIILLFVKILSRIRIAGRDIKIPAAIIIVLGGLLLGVIVTAIRGGSPVLLDIVPVISMGTISILFLILGSMMDFKQMRKIGLPFFVMGTIPLIIEIFVLAFLLQLITHMPFWLGIFISAFVSATSLGIIAPKLIRNMMGGYETDSQINQVSSLAGTLENITLVPFGLFAVIMFTVNTSTTGGSLPLGLDPTSFSILAALVALAIGAVIGVILSSFIVFILKPAAKAIARPWSISEIGLTGAELEAAKEQNKKTKTKSNAFFGTLFVILIFILVVIMEKGHDWLHMYSIPLLTSGGSMLLMIACLFGGLFTSFLASKNVETKESINEGVVKQGNKFFNTVGIIIIWGFGGFVSDPTAIFSLGGINSSTVGALAGGVSDSVKDLNLDSTLWANSPHIIWLTLFIAVAVALRSMSIFMLAPLFKWNTKQSLYMTGAFSSKGSLAVNNGATIILLLGVNSANPDQVALGYLAKELLTSLGIWSLLIGIITSEIFMNYGVDRWIFSFGKSASADSWKAELNKTVKTLVKENVITEEESKEVRELSNDYWKLFYAKSEQVKKHSSANTKSLKTLTAHEIVAKEKYDKFTSKTSFKIRRDLEKIQELETLKQFKKESKHAKYDLEISKLNKEIEEFNKNYEIKEKELAKAVAQASIALEKQRESNEKAKQPEKLTQVNKDIAEAQAKLNKFISAKITEGYLAEKAPLLNV